MQFESQKQLLMWTTLCTKDELFAFMKLLQSRVKDTVQQSQSDTLSKTQSVLIVWPLSSLKTSAEYNKVKGTPLNTKQSPKGAQRKS